MVQQLLWLEFTLMVVVASMETGAFLASSVIYYHLILDIAITVEPKKKICRVLENQDIPTHQETKSGQVCTC